MQETKKKEVTWDDKYRLRKESNLRILECLRTMVEMHPDWRFFQIMCNMGYDTKPDRFYDESYDTAEQMEACIEDLTSNMTKHD